MAELKSKSKLSGTDLIHADGPLSSTEVGPSISVTSTFKYPLPETNPIPTSNWDPLDTNGRHLYSRYSQNVTGRVEKILSRVCNGYALTYSSGLSAGFAALTYLQPTSIAITDGYQGMHSSLSVYQRTRGSTSLSICGIDDKFPQGTVCWLETPLNPIGESRNIKHYADKVHAVGGKLIVDSTFGPPPLQDPFKWGADIVMHSGTKYFGGHSDLLVGILVVKTKEEWYSLWSDRTFIGNVPGSLESWLLLRSLRTLHLRVPRQSANATVLARWLESVKRGEVEGIKKGVVSQVWHSSLQAEKEGWVEKQMEGGWNACFSFMVGNVAHAEALMFALKIFVPATSLGGVESLIDHRIKSAPESDPRLLRVSVGVEDVEDLKEDLRRALLEVVKGAQSKL